MDILDLLANKEYIHPVFLPIFSADDHTIIGYEIEGRYVKEEKWQVQSFIDDQVPEEYVCEIEKEYLDKAHVFMQEESNELLYFVKCNPNLIKNIDLEKFVEYFQAFSKFGVALNQWVIVLSEYEYTGENSDLYAIIAYLKTFGIKIAVNGIGKEDSHLNRIGRMNPDIITVHLGKLQQTSLHESYHHILQALTVLARKMGATILYENIMTDYQLRYAWRNNGRYFQGDFLSKDCSSPLPIEMRKDFLKDEMQRYITLEKKRLEKLDFFCKSLDQILSEHLMKIRKIENIDKKLEFIATIFEREAFRLYICDEDGFQISSNYTKKEEWILEDQYFHKNWSWRPYFLANIRKIQQEQKGNLSELYHDLETGQNIRTYSFPISESAYLFIDIAYKHLYEKDLLHFF